MTSYSQNKTFIHNATDLKEVLVGDAYLSYYKSDLNFLYSLDDDVQLASYKTLNRAVMDIGFHFWMEDPWMNSDGVVTSVDNNFNKLYSKIAKINSILSNVDVLKDQGEPIEVLEGIAGEALFLRAYYYFFLVNQYGKPYKQSSAATDFGVPLKLKAGVEDNFAERASTEKVYAQILNDLYEAEELIGTANIRSKKRANLATVHAFLSRVCLFMEKYDKAIHYADKVLANQQYHLYELNGFVETADFSSIHSPEVIFNMASNNLPLIMGLQADEYTMFHYLPSDELLSLYDEQDLRKMAFFKENSKGVYKHAKKKSINGSPEDASDFYLIRLAEVYLNKAEACALSNKSQEARIVIQPFLKSRFRENETPVISLKGETLVNFIRDERRKELCLEAHRWFDLRRYAVNSIYPYQKRIRHRNMKFTGTAYEADGYYELGTYAEEPGAYIIPISNDEIEFNIGHLKNEPRPNRNLKH